MKKLIKAIAITLFIFIVGFGIMFAFDSLYNRQIWDMTYSYEYALLWLPGGELIEGKVESWRDFDDGDQIQVKINGKTYLTHFANVVLISE
mgnify:CR=1 FL=1